MTVREINKLFEYLEFLEIGNEYFVFKDGDIYDIANDKTIINFQNREDLLRYKIDGKTISELLDEKEYIFYDDDYEINLKNMDL